MDTENFNKFDDAWLGEFYVSACAIGWIVGVIALGLHRF